MLDYHIETLSVWEAYEALSECPLCHLKAKMDSDYVDSYLGNAAMMPETRTKVNKKGFCKEHLRQLYDGQSRLPLALQLHTYLKTKNGKDRKVLTQYAKRIANMKKQPSFFKAGKEGGLIHDLQQDINSCIICEHIEQNMTRYIDTLLDLYQSDANFKKLFNNGKGYCQPHFFELLLRAEHHMTKKEQSNLIPTLIKLQLENQSRLEEEVLWFTKKFDYLNKDKPWGNSRDALPRTINKLKGQTIKTE